MSYANLQKGRETADCYNNDKENKDVTCRYLAITKKKKDIVKVWLTKNVLGKP